MNILWIHNGDFGSMDQDGHTKVAANILAEIRGKFNLTIFVICSNTDKIKVNFLKELAINEIQFIQSNPWFKRLSILAFAPNNKINTKEFDLVIYGSNACIDHVSVINDGCPSVLIAGDVETRKFSQKYFFGGFARFLICLARERLYKFFSKVVIYNPADVAFLLRNYSDNICVIPIGFHPTSVDSTYEKKWDLIFSGSFNYAPNYLAAQEILRSRLPSKYSIAFVGYGADRLSNLVYDNNRVYIKTDVSDIKELIRQARVYISPLSVGTGMKNKLFDAIDSCLPVVCSDLTIEGFDKKLIKKSVFTANNINDYDVIIERILSDYESYSVAALQTKQNFIDVYKWSVIAQKYLRLINDFK